MGIDAFDEWVKTNGLIKTMPISCLNDSIIGIDAEYFLEGSKKDSLLSALGGFPYGLGSDIIRQLKSLQSVGIQTHFVFNGLDHDVKDDPFGPSLATANLNTEAFNLYEQEQADKGIEKFKKSGLSTTATLSNFLKKILHEHGFPFTVAPYSAVAQLAYFEKHPEQFVDAIYGPSELFLYGVDKIIRSFDLKPVESNVLEDEGVPRIDPTISEFDWIDRRTCIDDLGRIPTDVFVDALLLAGSSSLRTFPPLETSALPGKPFSFRDAVGLIASAGRSVVQLCNQFSGDVLVKQVNYLDRYKRAITSIKHHIVITKDGEVESLNKDSAPSDLHDCVGQRLPEELNMYLSRGMVQPRVLNWLASGTILMLAPYDGGDSLTYQDLVRSQLEPLRRQALSLIADSLNRYYQRKEITTRFWFAPSYESKVNIKDLLPSPKESLASWNVNIDMIRNRQSDMEVDSSDHCVGSITFAIHSLADAGFASRTITSKPNDFQKCFKTREEISANTIWRFLQLRGYIDREHRLTRWGEILEQILPSQGSTPEREKAVFLAVELLRLDLLHPDTMFMRYSGAPMRGSDIDKRNCMMVSRVACLGKLIHQPKAYSGPLSRHLHGYHAIISALQASLRDLVEMSLVTMFLEGYVARDRNDWMDIALGLPFFGEDSCALGVLTLIYLDELYTREDPTSEAVRKEIKERSSEWMENSGDTCASLDNAFHIWDAVYHAVKQASAVGEDIKRVEMWDEVNEWLSRRR